MKKILIGTVYSIIAFAVISYITVMCSLLSTTLGDLGKPVTNIGFPLKYYYQFWCRGSDSPNCGWKLEYFIYDCLITWVITLVIYFHLTRNKKHNCK